MEKNKLHAFRNFIIPRRFNYEVEDSDSSSSIFSSLISLS
ncbi:unnamed protein product, partial [marine sediment metagenome]